MVFRFQPSLGRGRHQLQWPLSVDNGVATTYAQSNALEQPSTVDSCGGRKEAHRIILPQAQCSLFSLPAEIRLYVYELALVVTDEPVDVSALPSKHHLSILQTCRRIFYEAEMIFYALHRFRHSSQLFRIGPSRRGAITELTIVASAGATAFEGMRDLQLLQNLRSLYVQREMSIRYLNISQWSIMARQMKSELAKHPSLREVKVFTPAALDLTPSEEMRKEKLERVDAMLERDSPAGGTERVPEQISGTNSATVEYACNRQVHVPQSGGYVEAKIGSKTWRRDIRM